MSSLPKRRTRMVNFRLTDDEYEALKTICINGGLHSVSDFARHAVRRSMEDQKIGTDESFLRWALRLEGKVIELDVEVKRLSELLGVSSHVRTTDSSDQVKGPRNSA